MTPGRKNKIHKIILMIKSLPTPFFKKTAIGGKKIASIINKSLLFISSSFELLL